MIVIVRNVLVAGDRLVGELVEQAPTSARVLLEANRAEYPDGVWVPERSIDRVAAIDETETGNVLIFQSGTRMIEGTTSIEPGGQPVALTARRVPKS
jgi:hypothetical protein